MIGGKYLIERVLGSGAVGTVYLAVDQTLGRPVAIKVVDPKVASDPQVEARFRNEARLARHLNHPNTIKIFDYGRLDNGLPYMVMEFLRGKTLKEIIQAEGRIHPDRAIHIGRQILVSLVEAHGSGIIHRDLKPGNVIVGEFGGAKDHVKVVDFGIAKAIDESAEGYDLKTRAGMVVGSPAYMAPERLRGGTLTPSSDLFSWGIVMAEMITGTSIYGNMNFMEILVTHADSGPVPLPDWLRTLPVGTVIDRVTQKDPAMRIQTAVEVISELDRLKPRDDGLTLRPGAVHVQVKASEESTRPMAPAPLQAGGDDGYTVKMSSLHDEPIFFHKEETGWPLGYKILVIVLGLGLLGAIGVLIGVLAG